MNKKLPLLVQVFAVVLLAVYILGAIGQLFAGLYWLSADIIALFMDGGGNLTGLGLIFGTMLAGAGCFLLWGVSCMHLLLKGSRKGLDSTLLFLGLVCVLLLISNYSLIFVLPHQWTKAIVYSLYILNISSLILFSLPKIRERFTDTVGATAKDKKMFITIFCAVFGIAVAVAFWANVHWVQKRAVRQMHEEQKAARRDKAITDEFSRSPTVPVMVVCDIRRNAQSKDVDAIQKQRRKEAREFIIQPLGKEITDVEIFPWGDYDVYFTAEVTRTAYDLLKGNKHVRKIQLQGVKAAFRHREIVPVQIYYKTDDGFVSRNATFSEEQTQKNKAFALKEIIEKVDPQNFTDYIFSRSKPGVSFYMKVNQKGYEQLQKNKYVTSILLSRE